MLQNAATQMQGEGMAARPFIVLGDQTDHGGVVIEASVMTDTHGKGIARVGDQVTCPKRNHGTTVIVTGDPTMIIDGKAAARHGDKCACGATLISSQFVSTVGDDGGGGSSPVRHDDGCHDAPAPAAQSYPSPGTSDQPVEHDQHFLLLDEVTGAPLVGRKYKLSWSGKSIEGLSGNDGLTQAVSAPMAAEVKIEIYAEGVA